MNYATDEVKSNKKESVSILTHPPLSQKFIEGFNDYQAYQKSSISYI